MKLRKSRAHRKGRIEIIPMIDVMFFLLATFMLASLSMQHLDALKVNLPQGRAARMTDEKPLTLTITADNKILLNRNPANLNSLPAMIKPLLTPDKSMIVSADEHAQQGIVIHAMLAARQAGIEHFMIAVAHE